MKLQVCKMSLLGFFFFLCFFSSLEALFDWVNGKVRRYKIFVFLSYVFSRDDKK